MFPRTFEHASKWFDLLLQDHHRPIAHDTPKAAWTCVELFHVITILDREIRNRNNRLKGRRDAIPTQQEFSLFDALSTEALEVGILFHK